jgi:hypothetical protein
MSRLSVPDLNTATRPWSMCRSRESDRDLPNTFTSIGAQGRLWLKAKLAASAVLAGLAGRVPDRGAREEAQPRISVDRSRLIGQTLRPHRHVARWHEVETRIQMDKARGQRPTALPLWSRLDIWDTDRLHDLKYVPSGITAQSPRAHKTCNLASGKRPVTCPYRDWVISAPRGAPMPAASPSAERCKCWRPVEDAARGLCSHYR